MAERSQAEQILYWVLAHLGPMDASARVLAAGPQEAQMLEDIAMRNKMQPGQYLPDMQQRILEAAQRHPADVTVRAMPQLRKGEYTVGGQTKKTVPSTAAFNPGTQEIYYDPSLPAQDMPNTMAHELLHFLNSQSGRQLPLAAQHAIIQEVLGTNLYNPQITRGPYQPGALSRIDQELLRAWLSPPQTAPEPGREKAPPPPSLLDSLLSTFRRQR